MVDGPHQDAGGWNQLDEIGRPHGVVVGCVNHDDVGEWDGGVCFGQTDRGGMILHLRGCVEKSGPVKVQLVTYPFSII